MKEILSRLILEHVKITWETNYTQFVSYKMTFWPVLAGVAVLAAKGPYFLQKPLSKPCKNERKQQARFPFVHLRSNNDTCVYSCALSFWAKEIPLNKLFIQEKDFFNPERG